jgi:hypothetical protein
MPGFSYDENNNPVWVSSDYIEPDSPYNQPDSNIIPDDPNSVNDYWSNQTIDTNDYTDYSE